MTPWCHPDEPPSIYTFRRCTGSLAFPMAGPGSARFDDVVLDGLCGNEAVLEDERVHAVAAHVAEIGPPLDVEDVVLIDPDRHLEALQLTGGGKLGEDLGERLLDARLSPPGLAVRDLDAVVGVVGRDLVQV